jgi:hypothetical protein
MTAVRKRTPAYVASSIRRHRRTKAEIEFLRKAIISIVGRAPMTLRQLFYVLVTSYRDMVEKTEAQYAMVG